MKELFNLHEHPVGHSKSVPVHEEQAGVCAGDDPRISP